MKYFLCAGEASGDLHASRLIEALSLIDKNASFTFLGGDMMSKAAGTIPVIHYDRMAFMGFSEVIRHLGDIVSNFRIARQALFSTNPDALILIDYPSFNLKLAKEAKKAGIPVFYYISPKVWAWKEYRVRDIKRLIKKLYCILPFEVDFYRKRHDYEVMYVGNPSVEEVDSKLSSGISPEKFRESYGFSSHRRLVALVPGSRRGEIRNNLPVMMKAISLMPSDIQVAIAGAPGIEENFYKTVSPSSVPVIYGRTFDLVHAADAAAVTSGTATLECALIGTPQVVCYRANGKKLSYKIMERILKVPYVSLPNLISEAPIVPELLVHQCTPEAIASHLTALLPGGDARQDQITGYIRMRSILTEADAPSVTASDIYRIIRQYPSI